MDLRPPLPNPRSHTMTRTISQLIWATADKAHHARKATMMKLRDAFIIMLICYSLMMCALTIAYYNT